MIYADHASTTPLDPRVAAAVERAQLECWGNPSSAHSLGRTAKHALETARQTVADLCGVKLSEVIFTASGTESVHLALHGTCIAWQKTHAKPGHIITSATEHSCTVESIKKLQYWGWEVTELPVDEDGCLKAQDVANAIQPNTVIVSLHWVNNETGVIFPIEEIAKICREKNILLHIDALQGVGKLPLPKVLPDLLSFAAHKFGGPKGIACLLCRENIHLEPIHSGGGQEFGLRSGTENVPGAVGLAVALTIAMNERAERMQIVKERSEELESSLLSIANVHLNGHSTNRVPGLINIQLPKGVSGETMVMQLDLAGICASTGAACVQSAAQPSHVLQAMGKSAEESREAVRFSIGSEITSADVETISHTLQNIISR